MCATEEFIGTTNTPLKRHRYVFNSIAGTYDSGDMLINSLQAMNCATRGREHAMHISQINVWEKSPAGAQVKASLRFHFYNQQFTPPAQNAPFKGPPSADYTTYLGYVDVATGSYTDVGDGAGADPDYSLAQQVMAVAKVMRAGSTTNTIWFNIEIREAKTYGAATLTVDIETELH